MFIAGAVIMIVGFIAIRNIVNIYPVGEEKRHQEMMMYDKLMKNINRF